MAAYAIEWTTSALRELRTLDATATRRVLRAVTRLAADPRPPGTRAPAGQPAGVLRIRVGGHRVIYHADDGRILVTIVRVAHRREVYRDL
ncbi:type II toxin-antitoxin system RelE family toxin [Frankia gtarii]|uniref:type II toxin-antitoxin system RelE family toxin n=1 Tax=Frankia gtarii TaxID=2950102 RepID=UPI0021C23362|nr:type II toxin-antitoxin system RelE/ParE family toxin [Frankia gtarii]